MPVFTIDSRASENAMESERRPSFLEIKKLPSMLSPPTKVSTTLLTIDQYTPGATLTSPANATFPFVTVLLVMV